MHSEISEIMEAIRNDIKKSDHIPKFTGEAEECADLLIRLLDYCAEYNIPLVEALDAKMAFNQSRPYRHGKKF